MKTLRHTQLTLQFVRSKGVQVRFHGRGKNEPAHYCGQCEEEVFNILFIKEQEKKHVVHCLHCSRRHSPNLEGFVCLEEYHLEELTEAYDSFVLHPVISLFQITYNSVFIVFILLTNSSYSNRWFLKFNSP